MRWLVEVTSLGKAEKDALHVDADSWQKALQLARSLRGEGEAMSGFSIELLDEGCRAVDPASRLSYEVHRATGAETVRAVASRPSTAPRPPAAAGILASSLAPKSSSSPPPPNLAPSQIVVDEPVPIAQSPSRADPAALPSQIVFKREQDATDALPLTYREYVYVVPPSSSEAAAAAMVQAQLELVRASLERAPAGKLVNLAVFDATFTGRPTEPPLATISWKDWRGAALLTFPRQPGRAPIPIGAGTPSFAPAVAPVTTAGAAQTPASASPVPSPLVPATGYLAVETFTPAASFASGHPRGARSSAPSASATPSKSPGRIHGEDLIADLFESMHDLHFSRDAVEGGDFCLTLAMEKIPSLAGIVQLYDIDRREFLVTSARGAGTSKLLLRRFPESDELLAAAMRRRRAVVIGDAAQNEAAQGERYTALGGAWSLIVAPVMQAGRFLGAIELLNPIDGEPFTESDGNAVTYIAEQLAEFVAARGIVTDPERISMRPTQH